MLYPAEDVYQGIDFSRAGPDFSRAYTSKYAHVSFLPEACAQLRVLERSAYKTKILTFSAIS